MKKNISFLALIFIFLFLFILYSTLSESFLKFMSDSREEMAGYTVARTGMDRENLSDNNKFLLKNMKHCFFVRIYFEKEKYTNQYFPYINYELVEKENLMKECIESFESNAETVADYENRKKIIKELKMNQKAIDI